MTEELEKLGTPSGKYEAKLFNYLMDHPVITSPIAIDVLHDTRLAATVKRLRNKGYPIGDKWIPYTTVDGFKTRLKEYWLEK